MPHHFAINCNKYYINKSHSVQIAPTQGQNANQNPQGGDEIDDQIPHICSTPPLGVNIDRYITIALIDCPQTPQVVHNAYACSQKN